MLKKSQIKIKLDEAINAGKDKKGKIIKIPVFDGIQEIDGELYGIIEGYADVSAHFPTNKDSFQH